MALFMLSSFISAVLLCTFLIGEEVNLDTRHQENLRRIQKMRRALLGKMADVPKGTEITNCGGLFSEYGVKFLPPSKSNEWLIRKPDGAIKWHYDKEHHFWAGWRGPYYVVPPGEENIKDEQGKPVIMDGWGNPFWLHIPCFYFQLKSRGKDGQEQKTDPATDYNRDIEIMDYMTAWTIKVQVNNRTDHDAYLFAQVVFPRIGEVVVAPDPHAEDPKDRPVPHIVSAHNSHLFVIKAFGLTIGVRKVVIRDANTGKVVASKPFCVWPPSKEVLTKTEIDYTG